MALSGLDIYKLLPKTNCRECGFVTCLAFAMQLAKKAVNIEKCPYLKEDSKKVLAESSLPPIKLVTLGVGENKLEIGNETVLFRHEEKFHHPCGIGVIIDDNLPDFLIKEKLDKINNFKFERVGQELNLNLAAIRQNGKSDRFLEVVRFVFDNTSLAVVLISSDIEGLKGALEITKDRKPLIMPVAVDELSRVSQLAKDYKAAVVVSSPDLEGLSKATRELEGNGVGELVLNIGSKSIAAKIRDFTQARKQALKKANRSLGYPLLAIVESDDLYEEAIEAATYISKYAGIILLKEVESWMIFSLLTLRQNIYTDPQKPLQVEPGLYPVGAVDNKSPVIITTNFSLSYYTVLGEVEASKIPAYILSVDTEGMSVLTAWAAEKFIPEKVSEAITKFAVGESVSHQRVIIPGYVAVMSGDLEEKSGWQVIVGPKEASGIPGFLKNLSLPIKG